MDVSNAECTKLFYQINENSFWKDCLKQIHFHAFAFLHAFAFHIFIIHHLLIHACLIFFRHYIKTCNHESWTTYSASVLHLFQSKSNGRGSGYSSRTHGESSLGATRKICKNMWWHFPNNRDVSHFDQGKTEGKSLKSTSRSTQWGILLKICHICLVLHYHVKPQATYASLIRVKYIWNLPLYT